MVLFDTLGQRDNFGVLCKCWHSFILCNVFYLRNFIVIFKPLSVLFLFPVVRVNIVFILFLFFLIINFL